MRVCVESQSSSLSSFLEILTSSLALSASRSSSSSSSGSYSSSSSSRNDRFSCSCGSSDDRNRWYSRSSPLSSTSSSYQHQHSVISPKAQHRRWRSSQPPTHRVFVQVRVQRVDGHVHQRELRARASRDGVVGQRVAIGPRAAAACVRPVLLHGVGAKTDKRAEFRPIT